MGSAHINDHIDTVNLSRAAQEKLAKISDPIYREVVRDFFVNSQFRRDIFSRGSLGLTNQEQLKQLQETRFALLVNPANIKFEQQFPVGEVKLQEAIYQPICQVLAESPQTLHRFSQAATLDSIGFLKVAPIAPEQWSNCLLGGAHNREYGGKCYPYFSWDAD